MISFKLEIMDMDIYSEQMSYYQEQLDLFIRIQQVIAHWIRMSILSISGAYYGVGFFFCFAR